MRLNEGTEKRFSLRRNVTGGHTSRVMEIRYWQGNLIRFFSDHLFRDSTSVAYRDILGAVGMLRSSYASPRLLLRDDN